MQFHGHEREALSCSSAIRFRRPMRRCFISTCKIQMEIDQLLDHRTWSFLSMGEEKKEANRDIADCHQECHWWKSWWEQRQSQDPQPVGRQRIVLHAFAGRRRLGDLYNIIWRRIYPARHPMIWSLCLLTSSLTSTGEMPQGLIHVVSGSKPLEIVTWSVLSLDRHVNMVEGARSSTWPSSSCRWWWWCGAWTSSTWQRTP